MRTGHPNQSRATLEWLTYRESLLPHEGGGDRIKHARNGGEKKLKTSKGKEFVDGWYKNGNTAYEFSGWHMKHAIMPDRSPE